MDASRRANVAIRYVSACIDIVAYLYILERIGFSLATSVNNNQACFPGRPVLQGGDACHRALFSEMHHDGEVFDFCNGIIGL